MILPRDVLDALPSGASADELSDDINGTWAQQGYDAEGTQTYTFALGGDDETPLLTLKDGALNMPFEGGAAYFKPVK
ncbi:MAG: hypothetical protein LBT36_00425 [Oscillospiraceae bacterium]|nr:hypothetical protein [Oscillospiraceae bacterium]